MHYAGTRRSETNPLRSTPLLQHAFTWSAPSETDRLVGELRDALWAVRGYVAAFSAARAGLGRANRHNPAWRRASQREAMRALNVARGAMQRNARTVTTLQASLLALAVPADRWADAAAAAASRGMT